MKNDILKEFLQTKLTFDNSEIVASMASCLDGSMDFDATKPYIQTWSGRLFNPLNPIKEAIVIQDIAHALARICRFGGHSSHVYTVAQHSVLVSHLCNKHMALDGLLHDASEAYLGDVLSPLKSSDIFSSYRAVEKQLQHAILERFDCQYRHADANITSIKSADEIALQIEAFNFVPNRNSSWNIAEIPLIIDPWDSDRAEKEFLFRFFELKFGVVGKEFVTELFAFNSSEEIRKSKHK